MMMLMSPEEILKMNFSLISLGLILVVVGILILVIGLFLSVIEKGNTKIEGAGVIMLGPIPIGFGTSKEIMILAMILAIILMVLSFLFLTKFHP